MVFGLDYDVHGWRSSRRIDMGNRAAWVVSQLLIRLGQYKDWLSDSV